MTEPVSLSYILPIRRDGHTHPRELTEYLHCLRADCSQVVVVDGSAAAIFEANAAMWGSWVTHVPPDPDTACKMGKVAGVITGMRYAHHEHVVIADDDVRYEREDLERLVGYLRTFDLVRPQNYFQPLPWHARWDTARTLLNRALGADYPGTLGVRRSRFAAMDGYDGNVIFENLELIRTVEANGGTTASPLDLYVRRLPPAGSHFWGQRTRQAYDDFAIPVRMACWLAALPSLTIATIQRRHTLVLGWTTASIVVAEIGRRRAGGTKIFPASSSLLAPGWLLERATCAWLAVLQRFRYGGVRYGDTVIRTAAHSKRTLRRRVQRTASAAAAATARRQRSRPCQAARRKTGSLRD